MALAHSGLFLGAFCDENILGCCQGILDNLSFIIHHSQLLAICMSFHPTDGCDNNNKNDLFQVPEMHSQTSVLLK